MLNDKLLLLVLRRVASSFEEIEADSQGKNVGYSLAGRLPEAPCFFGFENTTVLRVDTEIYLSTLAGDDFFEARIAPQRIP